MKTNNQPSNEVFEHFLAELTHAAYSVALHQQGQGGSFLDLQLKLWSELREVFDQQDSRVRSDFPRNNQQGKLRHQSSRPASLANRGDLVNLLSVRE